MRFRFNSKKVTFPSVLLFLYAASSLIFAYIAEHRWNVLPCSLCYYYRYLLFFWILLLFLSFFYYRFKKIALFFMPFLICFSLYQVGVEYKWWTSPESCSKKITSQREQLKLTPQEKIARLREDLLNASPVPCDEIRWKLWGLSANLWNLIALLCLFVWGTRRSRHLDYLNKR